MDKPTKAALYARIADLENQLTVERAAAKDRNETLKHHVDLLRVDLAEAYQANAEWKAYAGTGRAHTDTLIAYLGTLPRKQVYRAMARALHPDMGGTTEAMQGLTAAYSKAN